MKVVRAVSSALLLGLAACGKDGFSRASIARAAADFARFAGRATGQETPMADEVTRDSRTAGHPGFDTGTYPGDKAMHAWRASDAPYEWAGFYLQAPCHPDNGWSGKRVTLTSMGYGLAVVYVGQQTWGRTPGVARYVATRVTSKVTTHVGRGRKRHAVTRNVTRTVMRREPGPARGATCHSDFVTAARGARDGLDAIAKARAEGFPLGTTIFLDLERMDVLPHAMREYYMAWTRAVLMDARFRPGIYAHTFNANTVYSDVKSVYLEVGRNDDPPFWIAKSRGFDITKLPSEVGHAFAAVWQGVLDVEQTWNGHKFPIDVNVSSVRSPSMPNTPVITD